MSSRHRNFRRRTDDDNGDDDNGNADKPSTTKPPSKPNSTIKPPKKPQNQAPKKLLSFADDEENDSPITRPSSSKSSKSRFTKSSSSLSSSHKLTAVKDRVTPSSSSSSSSSSLLSNVQPQAGTYTKEALLELQKNTRTLASSRPPPSTSKPTSSSFEPIIVLKGLVKPESDRISETITKLGNQEEEEIENNKRADLFRMDKDDATTRLASIGLGKGGSSSSSRDSIPDQATIDAIRARRERLRQSQAAAPDYIALDGGSNHGAAEGLSDEEPEFQGRIALFGEKLDTGKKGVFEDVVDGRAIDVGFRKDGEVDADDEDEEDKIWEEEQFRKGLGKRMDDGSCRVGSSTVPVVQSVPQQKYMYPPAATSSYSSMPSVPAGPSIGGAVGAFSGLDMISISQQAEIAKKALHDNLRRLKESHGRTMASLTRTDENISASLLSVTALEKSLSAAGEKFIFMQKIRDFVSVICDFLQHKAPFIEELEEQMQKLHEERAAAILERRVADQDDEMIEIEAAINAATMVLSKGGGNTALIEASTTAAQAASAAIREKNLPVKLDEFGRDENLQKRMDMARRAEARQRRKARSDSKRISSMENDSSYQQIEGESSTDESDSESTAYQSNRDLLLQTAGQIFSDAAEEYSQLSVVKERFERWKKDYSSSYNDAYVSLNVAAIFSPYVRLELLKWDPLHEDADFDNMKWHTLLYNYGIEDESKISPDDADADLIPQLVEKIAIPILHHEIAHCWDILSTRETKNAVSATNLVFSYVPPSSRAIGELVTVLRNRLADAVANLMVPTWSTLVMKAVPNASRIAAYRFGMSVRLMKNICLWNNIFAMAVLEKLALDDLLIRKVLPHLRSIQSNIHDAVTRTERTIATLYGVWAGPSVTGGRSPKLQPLVDYLLILGKTLEKKHVSGVSETETTGLARRLKKMLVELNEYDQARAISRTFNLKEAL